MNLEQHLELAKDFAATTFHLPLERSALTQYDQAQWNLFCSSNGWEPASSGIYVPKAYSAYILKDSPYIISNAFHELLGHGLFCEHSALGKQLVSLEQEGGNSHDFLYQINPNQLFGIAKQNIDNYESFALWMESELCRATGNEQIWEEKKQHLSPRDAARFKYVQSAEHALTPFGLLAQMGFPKHYTEQQVAEVLKRTLGSHWSDIEMVLLYGSKKPLSDIDIFMVSKNPKGVWTNGWLDVYDVGREEFKNLLSKFDISITDPLLRGELIAGSAAAKNNYTTMLLTQPITPEAISHNFMRAQEQSALTERAQTEHEKAIGHKYHQSYRANAIALNHGEKILTLQKLQQSKYWN